MDKLLIYFRYILLPFYILSKLIDFIRMSFLILSNEFLKTRLANCGNGVRLNGKVTIVNPDRLHLGNNVHINAGAYIRASGGVYIGDNCHISRNLILYSQSHNYKKDLLPYNSDFINKPVTIEKNVWIGTNVKITPGVKIGHGAIIGMGCVVGENVEPLCILLSNGRKLSRNKEHYESLEAANKYSGMSGFEI